MTRPLKRHKNYAELLIAALLTRLTWRYYGRKFPGIQNLKPLQLKDHKTLKVEGTPDAFVRLITWCAQLEDFKHNQRKNLIKFQTLDPKEQYEEIRDTLSTLAKYEVIQSNQQRRHGYSKPMWDFSLSLPHRPSPQNEQKILRSLFGEGKVWDQRKSKYHDNLEKAKRRKTKERVNFAVTAQKAFCQAMATEVIPHFPDRLSNYTKEALTGLADIIVPLETAIKLPSVDAKDHGPLLLSVGRVYLAQQQLDEAQNAFEECLTLKLNRTLAADSRHWLGIIHHQRGNYNLAQQYFTKALGQRTQLHGEKHPDVAASTHALAELFSDRGQFPEAETQFERARSLYEAIYGKKHSRVACVLNGLAALYSKTDRREQAESLYNKALDILIQKSDAEAYPHLAATQQGLGNLHLYRGEYHKAEQFHQDAINVIEEFYGPNHPNLAVHKASLALTYKTLGRLTEAIELYQECIKSLNSTYGNNHPQVGMYLSDLAWLISQESNELDKLKLAVSFFHKSLSILTPVLDPNHPSIRNARKGLNVLYGRIGNRE
ncbi:MAG: tetratricopeptide repeat protein [Moorea sp. SIOASIH]|uniref:tetratricopeptide repeat protein n=1 Tax=Moorena sp. SIOASIH TaxID=2607817 RepID=UPI0013B6D2AA|nr:tetratricopeptide repeat protein [Moorena sp. SIOASIH]NEO40213.1 tetratricopeptide repeat protein [Moorena sp. SIOASIH]